MPHLIASSSEINWIDAIGGNCVFLVHAPHTHREQSAKGVVRESLKCLSMQPVLTIGPDQIK
jgi:hypothetical protein